MSDGVSELPLTQTDRSPAGRWLERLNQLIGLAPAPLFDLVPLRLGAEFLLRRADSDITYDFQALTPSMCPTTSQ
jgi:hypothetical protein